MSVSSRTRLRSLLVLAFFSSASTSAQPVPLGSASGFGVLGASAVNNVGPSVVNGDLGIAPNTASSVTGFSFSTPPGPGQVIGDTHFADALAIDAQVDATTAYDTLAGFPCDVTIPADLGGLTLPAGVYCSASSMGLTGTVTLDAQGDPNARFVFQVGSALTTASNSTVAIVNGGQDCNVFWQIGSSATLGTGTNFAGTIVALTSITMTTGATTRGRAIARTGAVTLDSSNVTVCSLAGTPPSIAKSFSPASIIAGGISTLTITITNPNASNATLAAALVDTLPINVVVAAVPNAATTCGGGVPTALPGSSSVALPVGTVIAATASCTLTVDVTSSLAGVYTNVIAAGALVTDGGSNLDPATATLSVTAGVLPTTPIALPVSSTGSLAALAALFIMLAGLALNGRRRRLDA
jgi:hypothetical protein